MRVQEESAFALGGEYICENVFCFLLFRVGVAQFVHCYQIEVNFASKSIVRNSETSSCPLGWKVGNVDNYSACFVAPCVR